ncbi:MAG: metallophosphoesterase family protein, partial [Proteobacteria bacterium]
MMTPRKMFAHALMASLALATLSSGAMAQGTDLIDLRGEPAPPAAGKPYAARNLPDRIVLSPAEDPATGMGVSWRTDMAMAQTIAQLVEMVPSPSFGQRAQAVEGTSVATVSENGEARYHKVRFTGLKPDTAYAYRVQGSGGFSEWHQFHTASAEEQPFSFIYFGDTQNSILDIGSLAWRRALLQAGNPELVLHAGDLVASRDDLVHDDEWGQWTQAGGWALATVPQVVAAGNHEYLDVIQPDGTEDRRLGDHFKLSFALPGNGAAGAEATTYALDYQGVRIVVLDGTSALDLGTLEAQTAWLEARLAETTSRWKVVLMHQPIFTCARPNNTPKIKQAWQPLF